MFPSSGLEGAVQPARGGLRPARCTPSLIKGGGARPLEVPSLRAASGSPGGEPGVGPKRGRGVLLNAQVD